MESKTNKNTMPLLKIRVCDLLQYHVQCCFLKKEKIKMQQMTSLTLSMTLIWGCLITCKN